MLDPLTRKVQPLNKRQNRKPLSSEIKSIYRVLTITVAVLCLASTFSYLYINSLKPAKGYTLKQLQTDYENLQSENRDLERKIIDARSYTELLDNQELKSMEDANEFSFVEDGQVAKKNDGNESY